MIIIMTLNTKPRFLLSLKEVAGYYSALEKGFTAIGIEAKLGAIKSHPFAYSFTSWHPLQRLLIALYSKTEKVSHPLLKKMAWLSYQYIIKPLYFLACIKRFNVFVFGAGESFFKNHFDLYILKMLGKTTVIVFHGSDARPPYLDKTKDKLSLDELHLATLQMKKSINTIDKWATHIINAPATSQFHTRQIINWLAIGVPFNSSPFRKKNTHSTHSNKATKSAPIILHSPSNASVKGTAVIRKAINHLKSRGHAFEYIELQACSHSKVIKLLSRSSIVIDQLYSDTPCAGFATEACAMGKAVIVGGYEIEKVNETVEKSLRPPTQLIRPTFEALGERIIALLNDYNHCQLEGKKNQQFIEQHWDVKEIANKFLAIVNQTLPSKHLIPHCCPPFVGGVGYSWNEGNERLRAYINQFGIEALCLQDKPELVEAILQKIHYCEKRSDKVIHSIL